MGVNHRHLHHDTIPISQINPFFMLKARIIKQKNRPTSRLVVKNSTSFRVGKHF
jgi:hypothetical protein